MILLHCAFLHSVFHSGVRQRILKLILFTILNVYPSINFWINFCRLFRNFVCDSNHHNSFGSELTSDNKVQNSLVLYLVI